MQESDGVTGGACHPRPYPPTPALADGRLPAFGLCWGTLSSAFESGVGALLPTLALHFWPYFRTLPEAFKAAGALPPAPPAGLRTLAVDFEDVRLDAGAVPRAPTDAFTVEEHSATARGCSGRLDRRRDEEFHVR